MPEPIIDPSFEDTIEQLTSLIDSNDEVYASIRDALIDSGLGGTSGFLSKQSLTELLRSVIFPSNFSYGVGWQEVDDSLVVTDQLTGSMNGVTIELLEQYFDAIFTNTQQPEVNQLAQTINEFDWKNSDELKKQLLYSLCLSYSVSSLFYIALAGSSACNYPLRVMTADPCAGYLLAQLAFETYPQDGGYFVSNNLQQVPTPSGEVGLFYPEQFASMWIGSVEQIKQGSGAAFTINAIRARDQWLVSTTTPIDSNPLGQYQDLWRSRLLADSNGHLGTVVKINEQFNLNNAGLVEFSDSNESETLKQIGESYVRVIKEAGIDYDTLASGASLDLPEPTANLNFVQPSSGEAVQSLPSVSGSVSFTSGSAGLNVTGTQSGNAQLDQLLSIKTGNGGKINNFGGSQILLNSDRIILNSRTDYLMLFGGAGVSIASPNAVNIESDAAVTLYGEEGVFIGLPNKGETYNPNLPAIPANKAQATQNQEYEPLPLGGKLVDWLEDLIITLRNSSVLTPTGTGFLSEDTLYQLACLQARLPEIKSTYAFVDGISHEQPEPEPSAPAGVSSVGGVTADTQSNVQGSSVVDNPLADQFGDFYITSDLYNDPSL